MKLKGRVHKYGANLDTDVIIPARYLNNTDPKVLAQHCMEDIDRDFVKKVQPGDIIVAGTNFGCGSARDHAPIAIKASGISCIVAKTFSRTFFRNAINAGLPVLECETAPDQVQAGDVLEVELPAGEIRDITQGKTFQAKPYPQFIMDIIQAGDLIEYVRGKLGVA